MGHLVEPSSFPGRAGGMEPSYAAARPAFEPPYPALNPASSGGASAACPPANVPDDEVTFAAITPTTVNALDDEVTSVAITPITINAPDAAVTAVAITPITISALDAALTSDAITPTTVNALDDALTSDAELTSDVAAPTPVNAPDAVALATTNSAAVRSNTTASAPRAQHQDRVVQRMEYTITQLMAEDGCEVDDQPMLKHQADQDLDGEVMVLG